jgi:hypothetical protein
MMRISKVRKLFAAVHSVLTGLHNALFFFILNFFENINKRIRSKLPSWRMKEETSEHVRMAVEVFEVIVLPFSIIYLFGDLFFLKENAFDSMLWGIMIFFYSNFLPDLTCIFRREKSKRGSRDLPWYKKYSILLFAPLFVLLLFSNVHLGWKTTESFHNLKSLSIYGSFLLLLGVAIFGGFPISVGQVTEMLALPFYGAIGYLAHLKADNVG